MQNTLPAPGTRVWIRRQRWLVARACRDGDAVRLDVAQRERRATFLAPFDRPDTEHVRDRPRAIRARRVLAELAGLVARTTNMRAPGALVEANVEILPHQIEPALAVIAGHRRILIADEVGLGKTIQAGLIVAELDRRVASLRALLLVPPTLASQWRHELEKRFGLVVALPSPRTLAAITTSGGRGVNPWTQPGIWLASTDYLKQPHVMNALPRVPWDVVVIDEAHDVCGDSTRHAACARIARTARHLVLLTATPHSGDVSRFKRLEDLGKLSRESDSLLTLRRTRVTLGLANRRHVRWHAVGLSRDELNVLDTLEEFEAATLRAAGRHQTDAAMLLLAVFRKRALSTMSALDISLARRLALVTGSLPATPAEHQLRLDLSDLPDDFDVDEETHLAVDTGLDSAGEQRWLRRLRTHVHAALTRESKVTRLCGLLRRAREPVVVFTEFRHSLIAIERALASERRVVVLHGGQTAAERAQSLEQFLTGEVPTLIATDVAGQGLNLQGRARWVVSVELPWNPARLEQRIGRVDRLGQRRMVHATLLVARHPTEQGLLMKLAARVLAARESFGQDVLPDAAPPAAIALARALFGGHSSPSPSAPPTSSGEPVTNSCSAWQRTARAVARLTATRRALQHHWRQPPVATRRPRHAKVGATGPLRLPASSQLLVASVPIIDAMGAAVERRVVVVIVGIGIDSEIVRKAVIHYVGRRLKRVRTLAAARAQLGETVERAIGAELATDAALGEVQPGLFSMSDQRAFDAARDEAANIGRATEARAAEWRLQGFIEIGTPVIELVLCR